MTFEEKKQKYFIISWDQFHKDTRELAEILMEKGKHFKGIFAVTRGGLVPAGIIARELEIRTIKTICVSSYEGELGQEQGKNLNILYAPEGDGEGYLMIDELVDTGKTAQFVREKYPKAHFAVIYAKPEGKKFTDTFVHEVEQDSWLLFPWDMELAPNFPLISKKK